jgi:hypothetical protein
MLLLFLFLSVRWSILCPAVFTCEERKCVFVGPIEYSFRLKDSFHAKVESQNFNIEDEFYLILDLSYINIITQNAARFRKIGLLIQW